MEKHHPEQHQAGANQDDDHLAVVPHDALQLEEPLEGLFVDSELFVAQSQVVQSLQFSRWLQLVSEVLYF